MYSNIQPFKSVLYFCSRGGWTKESWLCMPSIQITSQRVSSASSGLDMSSSVQVISYMTYRSPHSAIHRYNYRYYSLLVSALCCAPAVLGQFDSVEGFIWEARNRYYTVIGCYILHQEHRHRMQAITWIWTFSARLHLLGLGEVWFPLPSLRAVWALWMLHLRTYKQIHSN